MTKINGPADNAPVAAGLRAYECCGIDNETLTDAQKHRTVGRL